MTMKLIDYLDKAKPSDIFMIWSRNGITRVDYKSLDYIDDNEEIDLEEVVVKCLLQEHKGQTVYVVFLEGYDEWYDSMLLELEEII